MKTMNAADANRYFSTVLREIARGEQVLVMSRGKPVAKIIPVDEGAAERAIAREALLTRLRGQTSGGGRNWTRDELYE